MINITQRGWRHIQKYHTGAQPHAHPKKSKFKANEDLVLLINQASLLPSVRTKRAHLMRIFNAGHVVGFDRQSGQPTSIVTVLTRLNGDLVTMFSGLP